MPISRWTEEVSRRGRDLPRKTVALCRLTLNDEVLLSALRQNLNLWRIRDLPLSEHDKPSDARYGTKAF